MGTFGRHRTEKMPYLNLVSAAPGCSASYDSTLSTSVLLSFEILSFGSSRDFSISEPYAMWVGYNSGFSFRNSKMESAVNSPRPPVSTKFQTKLASWSSNKLSKAEAMISPTLALQDQIPIRKPLRCPENHRLKIPMMPGQPVA